MRYYFDPMTTLSDNEILDIYVNEIKSQKSADEEFVNRISDHNNLRLIKLMNVEVSLTATANLEIEITNK